MDSGKFRGWKHRGTEGTEGGGKKQREGIEGIGRGKRYRRGCPTSDWILGVWVKAPAGNSVDFVPLCLKRVLKHRGTEGTDLAESS